MLRPSDRGWVTSVTRLFHDGPCTFQHDAPEDIRQILKQAGDFGIEDDLQPEPDGSLHFPWFETRSRVRSLFAPIGQRILANLTLTPTTLKVEAMSQQRLDDCCQRLERLLGDRIRLIGTQAESVDQALRKSKPRVKPEEPFMPPPEVIAEIEEKMLRQWIDDSIQAYHFALDSEQSANPANPCSQLEGK
jgi:hypothetical protein